MECSTVITARLCSNVLEDTMKGSSAFKPRDFFNLTPGAKYGTCLVLKRLQLTSFKSMPSQKVHDEILFKMAFGLSKFLHLLQSIKTTGLTQKYIFSGSQNNIIPRALITVKYGSFFSKFCEKKIFYTCNLKY